MKMGVKYLYDKLKTVFNDILTQNVISHFDFLYFGLLLWSNMATQTHVAVCQTLAGRWRRKMRERQNESDKERRKLRNF